MDHEVETAHCSLALAVIAETKLSKNVWKKPVDISVRIWKGPATC